MLRTSCILLSLVLSFFFQVSITSARSTSSKKKLLLWKVKGKHNTVTLLGSIHMLDKSFYPLNKQIIDSFRSSDILVVEANIRQVNQAFASRFIRKYGTYLKSKTKLSDVLSKKTNAKLLEHLKSLAIPSTAFQKMKPWFVALQLTRIKMMKGGQKPQWGLDWFFLKKAAEKKMKILELEGLRFQLSLFSRFSKKVQEQFLLSSLEPQKKMMDDFSLLKTLWKQGKTKIMAKKIFTAMNKTGKAMYKELILKRNRRMARLIANYLKKRKNYFVIVGAGHLVGKHSIQAFLKQRKFDVTQCSSK